MEKTCNICKQTKPVSEFFKRGRGYQYRCKQCVRDSVVQKMYDMCKCGRKKLISSNTCAGCVSITTRESYDPKLIEWVKTTYESGKSTWKIAAMLGTNQMRVRRLLIRSGVHLRENTFINRGKFGKDNPVWNGYEGVSGGYFNVIRIGAAKRNITFEINIEDVWDQYVNQDKKCALTGLDIVLPRTEEHRVTGESTASLDRKDSKLGYTKQNIQFVHKRINVMKGNLPEDEFRYLCKLVVEECKTTIHPVLIDSNFHNKRKIRQL